MSLLRNASLSGIIGLSAVTIGLVTADRLTHSDFMAAPATVAARPASLEPEATATVTQGAEIPDEKPMRAMSGFDTERLHALLRGEGLPAAPKKR